ncbi:SDR family NAD(P)-dependent oxidoreductase [Asanoa sp. NPDC049573]|uniref:SDR family NAD(P)-dependent oxidoreductase n=1 Tax=Asanoa sp. NPDC049573 TaxID=3155396 RepID=UPI00342B32B8
MAFDARSTAAEVVAGIDLSGQRAVITGGASGIGRETARALAAAGAEVTIAVRDPKRTAGFTVERLDLADLDSVRAFAGRWEGPLHILVNNAAVTGPPRSRTAQGWELQFGANHLGHFALATALQPAMVAADGARVVEVTSAAHLRADVDFDDLNFERRGYDAQAAYDQSKTANVLFVVEAARRWAHDGVTADAVNPGPDGKTPQQGAATSVYVATAPSLAGVSGRYFEDCHEAGLHQPGGTGGVAPYAIDPANAARLWEISAEAVAAG